MPIRAESACAERWSSFEPRPGGRHCGSCDVTVVDLSRLTRRKAEALVIAAGGRLCARLRVDARGEPVFRPESPRAPAFFGAAALGLLTTACEPGAALEARPSAETAPSALDDASPAHFGGSLMSVEHSPMRPLSPSSEARPTPGPSETAAIVEDVVPTEEQRLLTEAKSERERHAARRGRGGRARAASVAPGTIVHPLPPIGAPAPGNVATPPTHLHLGGISYTP